VKKKNEMKIPKYLRETMPSVRRANADDDPDDVLEFSSSQTEARLSRQVVNDKRRAIVNRTAEITRKKGGLNLS